MSRHAPFRKAIETIAVPWATQHGFSRASAHAFTRPATVPGVLQLIELQKSVKHPHRTFTINLGFFHPSFTTDPLPAPNSLTSVHCARRIRLGRLMSKRFWTRLFLWLRFGSGWHWWQLLPGDFWWSYRETDDSLSVALLHSLDQLERYGFLWFYRSDSLPSANELFDRSHFAAYELRGFYPQLQSA